MSSTKKALFSLLFAPFFLLALPSRDAHAQVHWDASLQAGGSGRLFSNGGLTGSIGPVVGIEGDVAVVPLLRLGLYADYEYADTGEPAAPSAVSFGGRVKLMLPGYRHAVHLWIFSGFGGVFWDAPQYGVTDPTSSPPNVTVTPATGWFLEVPVGVGMGWRFRRPWELVAELQGRIGFDMNGSYFGQAGGFADQSGNSLVTTRPTTANDGTGGYPTGNDVLAILLTVGIGFDE